MSYLIPIVAVVVGALALGEPLRPRLVAGSALVLAGLVAVNRGRAPHGDVDEPHA
jgi:drug/metabolite transporter (DMT)-like permease